MRKSLANMVSTKKLFTWFNASLHPQAQIDWQPQRLEPEAGAHLQSRDRDKLELIIFTCTGHRLTLVNLACLLDLFWPEKWLAEQTQSLMLLKTRQLVTKFLFHRQCCRTSWQNGFSTHPPTSCFCCSLFTPSFHLSPYLVETSPLYFEKFW